MQTRTINFSSIIDSRSLTHYSPSPTNNQHTDYTIWVQASAFSGKAASSQGGEAAFVSTSSGSGWGLGLGLKVEEFTAGKLLGNVKQARPRSHAIGPAHDIFPPPVSH